MPNKLPQRICVLDLETDKTSFKQPEKSKLLFVGILIYVYSNGKYRSLGHKVFLPGQLSELQALLKEFSGLVIGHNIFQFDYRVLRPLISLEGIVEKTVDTLVFLHRQKGEFGGLSLRDLARANLKRHRKMDLEKMPGQLWRGGQKRKVIKYNRTDCVVTRMIWQHCITRRKVKLGGFKFQVQRVNNGAGAHRLPGA